MKEQKRHSNRFEAQLLNVLEHSFAERLSSVVAYGSYVAGTWTAKASDINVLILVKEFRASSLEELGRRAHRFLRRYRVTPLILSENEFSRSADVFPMEYMDIIARHRVLYGGDPTEHVQFSRRNLRHQLEHQLRGLAVSLRQLLVAAHGRKRLLANELKQSAGSVSALFRGLLRLHAVEDCPTDHHDLVERVAQAYEVQLDAFAQLFALRSGARTDVEELSRRLMANLDELIHIVDQYETGH